MMVIPAIDLRGGRCVRLVQGRAEAETVFAEDPLAVGRAFAERGAERLHVVDLDGAFTGAPRHAGLIAELARAVPVPIQVGGGLRDLGALEAFFSAGVRWAVLGTRAALEPAFLREACRSYPDRILVGVDAVDGRVAVDGWTRILERHAEDLAREAAAAGAAGVIYTDVRRDGTGEGPNLEATAALARVSALPLFAAGGIARLDDLRRLAAIPGVEGAVVGRALYTGAIDLGEALAACAASAGGG